MTNHEQYKERLRAFNNTPKYREELYFLYRLVCPHPGEKILDYGCGLGTAVHYFNRMSGAKCFGYDVNNYRDQDDEAVFRSDFHFKFSKVFFMHSLAHLPNVEQKLEDLKQFLKPESRVYVITPNEYWLSAAGKDNYIPDPTVVKHFSMVDLEMLLYDCGYKINIMGQFGAPLGGINERLFLEAQWK